MKNVTKELQWKKFYLFIFSGIKEICPFWTSDPHSS